MLHRLHAHRWPDAHPKPYHRKTIGAEIRKMRTDGMRLLVDGETIRV